MSDRQVAEFFKKPSTGSVCGRFMTDQLDRTIEIPKKRIPWVKYFFQFAIPAFLVSIKASAQKTQGKIKVNTVAKDTTRKKVDMEFVTLGLVALPENLKPFKEVKEVSQPQKPVVPIKGDIKISVDTAIVPLEPVCSREIMGKVAMPLPVNKNEIEGRVVNEKGEPVPYAAVLIKGTKTGVVTNADGAFVIKPGKGVENIILIFSAVGYVAMEIPVSRNNVTDPVVMQLTSAVSSFLVGELVVCRSPSVKKEIKEVPLMPSVINNVHSFKVFPNPVSSKGILSIEWKQREEGYCNLQLLNQSGRSVHEKEIWIDAGARSLSIDVPSVPAGSYFLVLTNKKSGKKFTEKIIIQ
jgi:hypothetical protein